MQVKLSGIFDFSDKSDAGEVIASPIEPEIGGGLLRQIFARFSQNKAVHQASWVTFSYCFAQVMRLATNVILAYLLVPQLFGLMLIVNTLRTGIELLSDIGITANIISNSRGEEPKFYNTAFTLQVLRGFLLAGVVLFVSVPLTHLYNQPELVLLIPLISVLLFLSGLAAPSIALLLKRGEMRLVAASEILISFGSLVIHVALALFTRTVWALYFASVFTTILHVVITHILMRPNAVRVCFDYASVKQILSFGKWVFASSLIYFLAVNYDRLYFAKAIPFAVLGVYGVARTFSDTATQIVQRIGNMLIYPRIAASQQDGPALRSALAPIRGRALTAVAAILALGVACADRAILLIYDSRYHSAAFMLPILLAGVWFSILATLGESVLMGTGRPAHVARANFLKFAFTCVGLPLALRYDGMAAALLVIACADFVRYASLTISERILQMSFVRQDLFLTLSFVAMTCVWRILLYLTGIVQDLANWWSLGAALHS